ncbi:MAG: formyltetrahydrofolate deformylase [Polyangia bacterium]|jgi:formyltetrahydrofolate deformylase
MAQEATVTATLLVSCRDRTGLVAALSSFVFEHGGNILDADQHAEAESGDFFMRLVWDLRDFALDREQIRRALAHLAERFALSWELTFSDHLPRVVVFASKASHCLYDLLLCQQIGDLGGKIVAVVSNHDLLVDVCRHFEVPFTAIPIDRDRKAAAEAEQLTLLASLSADLVVLARYMQILSSAFVAQWPNRIINIHHSFLPAFAGARPYHQAKERGVKIIGATAHYVTAELDQGPIIEQNVRRVSHRDAVEDLMRAGRDLEREVLTRAVRLHLQRRVLVSGNRTIVFG